MKKVSVVVPVYIPNMPSKTRLHQMTMLCLKDLHETTSYDNLEIILVDDGAYDTKYGRIWKKKYPDITVLRNDTNLGFAKTVNYGIKNATGELILLLNNDVYMTDPNWLTKMINTLESDNLDMTAPTGGRMTPSWNYIEGEAKTKKEKFSYLTGWALLVKRCVFNKIGYIPEDFGLGFWEDTLFSYRAKQAGFKLGISEGIGIVHYFHSTFNAVGIKLSKQYSTNREIFLKIINNEKKKV